MFKDLSLAVLALAAIGCAPAFACDDQAGQVIFEDSFPDDTGGWEIFDGGKVVPPEYVLSMPSGVTSNWAFNQTFNATDGDYCMQFKMPAVVAPDIGVGVGLVTLGSDSDNFFLFQAFTRGNCGLYKKVNKAWTTVWSVKECGLKLEPDALNTLRLTVKDGKITAFANGAQLKAVRAQIPSAQLKFGFYSQLDAKTEKTVDVKITEFKVMSGQ
jgi:hypothetical protein